MIEKYVVRDSCRSCGSKDLMPVFDMGMMPLANALPDVFVPWVEPERYPLSLHFCRKCALVQIKETIHPDILFRDYLYFSSQSKTMVESARLLAEENIRNYGLGPGSVVMEAASNDGYLLQHYVKANVQVIGVDPARNIAEMANANGIPTIPDYFTSKFADNYAGQIDVFHANNVLAHVQDQNDFVEGIAKVLKPDGVAIIEVPYLGGMIEGAFFDQIYHEHSCYFSVSSIKNLFNQHNLIVVKVERIPLHSGSLRVFVKKPFLHFVGPQDSHVDMLLATEALSRKPEYYLSFGERVNRRGMELWRVFERMHRWHKSDFTVAAYGAAAKGNQLLNYFKIDNKIIDCVYDSTPAKQERYMSGYPIPIVKPQYLDIDEPTYTLILAWNFAEEIMSKHKKYMQANAFLVPFPEIRFYSDRYSISSW